MLLVITIVVFLVSYVLFTRVSVWLGYHIRRRVCSFCFSSAVAVAFLVFSRILQIQYAQVLLPLFMMQSGVGIAFLSDEFIMHHRLPLTYETLKIGITMTSIISSYLVLQWSVAAGITLFVPVLLFGFFALTPETLQANSKKTSPVISEREHAMVQERLKKCC